MVELLLILIVLWVFGIAAAVVGTGCVLAVKAAEGSREARQTRPHQPPPATTG